MARSAACSPRRWSSTSSPTTCCSCSRRRITRCGPGSTIILETINPACWFAFFSSYIRDITHVRPLHPDTLSYLLVANGFQKVRSRYSAPYPEADKLKRVAGEGLVEEALNFNVDKLNSLLFTYLDYAAVGMRS